MSDTVKVKVKVGWSVFDGTEQRNGGEQLDVTPEVAEPWVAAGWAERVDKPAARTRRRRDVVGAVRADSPWWSSNVTSGSVGHRRGSVLLPLTGLTRPRPPHPAAQPSEGSLRGLCQPSRIAVRDVPYCLYAACLPMAISATTLSLSSLPVRHSARLLRTGEYGRWPCPRCSGV